MNVADVSTSASTIGPMHSDFSSEVLKRHLLNRLSIEKFYMSKDVGGCIQYVQKLSYKPTYPSVDSKSLKSFYTMRKKSKLTYEEPKLECEYLKCDVLCENFKTCCIPIKCPHDISFGRKVLRNPLALLESESLAKRVADLAEPPYQMDYDKVRQRIDEPKTKTGSRDVLKGVYVLNSWNTKPMDLIRHNNYVLSTLFRNNLPGKDVLWHMIFLYILAQKRFPELKERLYEEIRFLGKQRESFLTLDPPFDPPIVDKLEVCFWYIAHVCHKAFPNDSKNVLRTFKFNPQFLLQFYTDVYEPDYIAPEQLPLWQLNKTLNMHRPSIIPILSHYFEFENLDDDSEDPFQCILYGELKSPQNRSFSSAYRYLAQLKLETVLAVNRNISRRNRFLNFDKMKLKTEAIDWMTDGREDGDKLDHVKIHLKTCHPLVTCPETGRHWRDCIGKYDVLKESNLRLFRSYCKQYMHYPSGWRDLLVFQNRRLYELQGRMPHFFPRSIRKTLETVMVIFEKVMITYPCKMYLACAEKYREEEVRIYMEKRHAFNDQPDICIHCHETLF